MQNDVQKKGYTLELHSEMKTIYENLDTFDFRKWHQEKMRIISKILYVVIFIIIKEYIIFLLIIYYLPYDIKRDKQLHYEYLQTTSRLLDEMIVQNSK